MKKLILCGVAAFAVVVVTGCRMCSDPVLNDPSCIEDTHEKSINVDPENSSWKKPKIAESLELFRPVFKAGARTTVTGEGLSEEAATFDAIAKFMIKTNSDYIVAVSRIISKKTHPTSRWFATTNHSVTISGIPITLEKLSCETLKKEDVDKKTSLPVPNLTVIKPATAPAPKADECKHKQPFALLELSDIDISIKAKAETDDKVGVAYPAKKAK